MNGVLVPLWPQRRASCWLGSLLVVIEEAFACRRLSLRVILSRLCCFEAVLEYRLACGAETRSTRFETLPTCHVSESTMCFRMLRTTED